MEKVNLWALAHFNRSDSFWFHSHFFEYNYPISIFKLFTRTWKKPSMRKKKCFFGHLINKFAITCKKVYFGEPRLDIHRGRNTKCFWWSHFLHLKWSVTVRVYHSETPSNRIKPILCLTNILKEYTVLWLHFVHHPFILENGSVK